MSNGNARARLRLLWHPLQKLCQIHMPDLMTESRIRSGGSIDDIGLISLLRNKFVRSENLRRCSCVPLKINSRNSVFDGLRSSLFKFIQERMSVEVGRYNPYLIWYNSNTVLFLIISLFLLNENQTNKIVICLPCNLTQLNGLHPFENLRHIDGVFCSLSVRWLKNCSRSKVIWIDMPMSVSEWLFFVLRGGSRYPISEFPGFKTENAKSQEINKIGRIINLSQLSVRP